MKSVSIEENGVINRSEFLTATLDKSILLNEENVRLSFNYFDINNTNYITS